MKRIFSIVLLLAAILFTGCSGHDDDKKGYDKRTYTLYYINESKDDFVEKSYSTGTKVTNTIVSELLDALKNAKGKCLSPFLGDTSAVRYDFTGDVLTIDISENYYALDNVEMLLLRSSLAKTFSQIDGVRYISLTAGGNPLQNSYGGIVGILDASNFIDGKYTGGNIKQIETVLYFAGNSGDRLVGNEVVVDYDAGVSPLQAIVEYLIDGPDGLEGKATIPKGVHLVGITEKDGICYVNFDSAFLDIMADVSPEVTIYSIVNSLCETGRVKQVQIMIEGKSDVWLKDKLALDVLYERNLDIVDYIKSSKHD